MRNLLQQLILALHVKSKSHMRKSRARYKSDYDSRVREMPSHNPGIYVFTENPLMSADQETANPVANHASKELQSRTTDPLKIWQVRETKLVMGDNEVPETISIDHSTPTSMEPPTSPTSPQSQRCAGRLQRHQDNSAQSSTEHVVDHIVRNIGKKPNVKNFIRFYGYGTQLTQSDRNTIYPHALSRAIGNSKPRINLNNAIQPQQRNKRENCYEWEKAQTLLNI